MMRAEKIRKKKIKNSTRKPGNLRLAFKRSTVLEAALSPIHVSFFGEINL
jgi:hypothetical protein